jgi:FkbM family methyltransferase
MTGILLGILEELDSFEQGAGRPLLNPGSGRQVVNWYGPALKQAVESDGFDAIVTSVRSTIGDLLYPTFDRFMLPAVKSTGTWEAEEAEFVRARLRQGGHALNVGANVGFMTLVMSHAVGPEGLVIAIEPEPFNFSLLWENVRRNRASNVLPIHAAAGEETGSIRLNLSPDNSGDHRTARHPVGVSSIEVPVIALDDLLEDVLIDVVAIDAQGFDHRIVRGMAKLVARCRPPMLVEFWPTGILELGESPASVIDEYRDLGYRVELFSSSLDVTGLPAEEIVSAVLKEKDHGTLALT